MIQRDDSIKTEQDIIAWLQTQAISNGITAEAGLGYEIVSRACMKFIKLGSKSVEQPAKRERVPRSWIAAAWKRQGGHCCICNDALLLEDAAGEHIVPVSRGGKTVRSNIAAAHGAKSEVNCNSRKGSRGVFAESKRTSKTVASMFAHVED